MPIVIIIAIFAALFTLGATMDQPKRATAKVEIINAKQIKAAYKKDNQVKVTAAEQDDNTQTIREAGETGAFENIFQFSGLYQIIN